MAHAPGSWRASTHSGKENKEIAVLRLIHEQPNISQAELVGQSGFSGGLVSEITQRLITKGLVAQSAPRPSSAGRKALGLTLRQDAASVIGVDLGSYHLRVIVTDIVGNVVTKYQTQTRLQEGRERVLARTFSAIEQAIAECGIPIQKIRGIGVGHSGIVDATRGIVLSFPRPAQTTEWKNVPLRKMLHERYAMRCVLEDSVRAIALAELRYGIGKQLSDFIYVDVGMGIGAGIILKGDLYRGPGGGAGEFGHLTVVDKGPLCCCGNSGCLETVASCAAIISMVNSAIQQGVDSRIRELAEEDLDRVSIELIGEAARQNDSLAFRVFDRAVGYIGVALADVVNLLNPTLVILGGPLFRAAPYLLDPLQRVMKQHALERCANQVQLRVSQLGSEGGAMGAASAVAQMVVEDLHTESCQ
ncbi:MAG TPA: ROK family transcriptional regulator [Terriglobales bacterium]|nr:ROK family transcriptional regulator [Terriglobales bacterium]